MNNSGTDFAPKTIREALPGLSGLLKWPRGLLKITPEPVLDFRPDDAKGEFCFSVAEIYAHLADARYIFIGDYILGKKFESLTEAPKTFPKGEWVLKVEKLTRPLLEKALDESLAEAEKILDLPIEKLLQPTEAGLKFYQELLKKKEAGEKVNEDNLRNGPMTYLRALAGMSLHEAHHRGTLIAHLKNQGVNIYS